jgi:hypothetical protein
LYGDGNFVSGENIIACAERGVDLQGNLTGSDSHPEKLKLADFKFAEDGTTVIACPAGRKPLDQSRSAGQRIAFKERNNIRAGIESTNAEMKTRHGMGRLRVRDKQRVEYE